MQEGNEVSNGLDIVKSNAVNMRIVLIYLY